MKKFVKEKNKNSESWFNWLTQKFNEYEAFNDFDSGKNPQDVAENFISINELGISEVFEKFDEEDKDALDQFQKLTECEWHVLRIIKSQLEFKNKVKFVDFKKKKKIR